jgi:4-hydroxy-3-methylbut-2-enyl diphosphate reductase
VTRLVVCTSHVAEAQALARPGLRVLRTGTGHARARAVAGRLPECDAVAITGFAGALDARLQPGSVLVATEVRGPDGTIPVPTAALLAGLLERNGITVHRGPLLTADHTVTAEERAVLASTGALAADTESAPLAAAAAAAGRPCAVVRVIAGTPPSWDAESLRPLRALGPALTQWGATVGPRRVLLAAPRSFCAGVERAIEIVERALERYGAPVYVRKQIVHNVHVVEDLRHRGAVFVDDLAEVPPGSVVIFSAHGVAPSVREQAGRAGHQVIDATCPLVAKVHAETRRYAARGDLVALIGHAGHEETEGTLGEAPGSTVLVETPEDVAALPAGRPIAYLMQTTLAADEAGEIASAITRRFPSAEGPGTDDICYATTNRQRAVTAVARDADLVVVVGSANSSNSRRLVEVAERCGTPSVLVDGPADLPLERLRGARVIGLTAGASAPHDMIDGVVECLRGLGPVEVEERTVAVETTEFTLPKEVRH